MANAFYYANNFHSNGSASVAPTEFYGSAPRLQPGQIGFYDAVVAAPSAVLATTDEVYLARLPGGHVPLKVELDLDGDLDTGANTLAVKIGSAADDDLVVAGAVIGNGDRHYEFPTNTAGGSAYGDTTSAKALRTTAAPSDDYSLIMIPTVPATTSSTGTTYVRVWYGCPATVLRDSDAPAAVAGTQ